MLCGQLRLSSFLFRLRCYQRPSNTPNKKNRNHIFTVVHRFHPLCGQQFELLEYRLDWGEDRVYYIDSRGRRRSIPAEWTDVVTADPFVIFSDRRSHLRVVDLLELAKFVKALKKNR